MQLSEFTPLSFSSPEQRHDLSRRYGFNVPYVNQEDYSWLEGVYEQIHAYNSISLLTQDGTIENAYTEKGYSPANDLLVQTNKWISGYYPEIWQSIMESNSSKYSKSIIDNVSRNHKSAKIIGSQGLLGGLAGGLVAGFFDPINWIFPSAGLFLKSGSATKAAVNALKTQRVANDVARLTASQRATYGAIDNLVATAVLEPLMQEKNLTRTERDFMNDLIGSAVFGAGFGASIAKIGDGLNTTRRSVSRRLTGSDSIEEAIETAQPRLEAAVEEEINLLPAPEREAALDRMSNVEDYLAIIRDEADIVEADLDLYERAFNTVFPKIGELKGLGKVVKWFVMNPNQQLFRTGSQEVIRFATDLLEGNLIFENNNTRTPVESKIKLVDFMMRKQIGEYGKKSDNFSAENAELDLSSGQLRELVTYLVISGETKVEDAMDFMFKDIEDMNLVDRQIFKSLKAKQIELGNEDKIEKLFKFIEDQADEYRGLIQTLDRSLDSGGFLSSVLRSADKNPLQLSKFISRWVSEEGAAMQDLFVLSVVEGIRDRRGGLIADIYSIKARHQAEIEELEGRLLNESLNAYDTRVLTRRVNKLKEKVKSADEEVIELQKLLADERKLELFAKRIVHNYTLSYDKTVMTDRGYGFGNQVQETLARKVDIKDSYLMPFMVRDPAAILDKARLHLMPKVILADELLNKYGAGGYRNFNRSLGQQLDKLAEMQTRLEEKRANGEDISETEVAEVKILQDEVIDDIATSRLVNELVMVKDFAELGLDEQEFTSLKKVVQEVLRLNEKRKAKRKEAADILTQIKEKEGEIGLLSRQGRIPEVVSLKADLERKLADLELLDPDQVGTVYEDVLNTDYVPLGDIADDPNAVPHNLDSRLDNTPLEINLSAVSSRGSISITHFVNIGNRRVRVRLKEASVAGSRDSERGPIQSETTKPLLYWEATVDGELKWGWVNPLELQRAKQIAFFKRLNETASVTEKAKINAKLDHVVRTSPEFKVDENSTLLKDDFVANRERLIEVTKQKIEDVKQDIAARTEPELLRLSSEHERLYTRFKSVRLTMNAYRRGLNDIAQAVTEVNSGKADLVAQGLAKPFITKAKEEADEDLSLFEYIGYEDNFKYYDQYGWNPSGVTRSLFGADLEDMQIGYSLFQGDVYNTAQLAQAQRRANNQFILNPQWMIRAIDRSGELENVKSLENVADNLKFIFDQLQNKSAAPDSYLDAQKTLRIIRNMNYMRYMGMVTIASLGDFANAVGTMGLTRYARTLLEVFGDLKDKNNRNSVATVIAAAEHAEVNYRNTQMFGIDGEATYIDPHTGNPYNPKRNFTDSPLGASIDRLDEWTRGDSKTMNIYNRFGNFLSRWNAFNKEVVALGLEDMLIEIAIKHSRGQPIRERDKGILKGLRFGEEDLTEIYRRWKSKDEQDPARSRRKKIVGRDFYLSNSADWTDNFGYQYQMKLQAAVDTIIVTPSIGDLPKFMKNPAIAPLFQFKSFMFASTQKLLLPMIQRGVLYKDPAQLMMLFGTAMLGTLSYATYEILAGRDIFQDSVTKNQKTGKEERVSWINKLVLQGIDRSGSFALLFELNNMAERHMGIGVHKLFGGQLDKRYRSRTLSDTLLGPFGSFISDAGKTLTLGGELLRGEAPLESQLTSFRRMFPFQNAILARTLFDGGFSALEAMSRPAGFYNRSLYDRYTEGYKTIQGRFHKTVWGE